MAKKGSLSFVELHVEKLVLGVAAVFALGLVVYYLMGPNKIEYGGRALGPGELDEAILAEARRLDQALENAEPEVAPVPDYRRQLQESFQARVVEASARDPGPPLARALPPAAPFGKSLPTFEDQEEGEDIVLVTPPAPTPPVVRTGISLVKRQERVLQPAASGVAPPPVPPAPGEEPKPEALSWVTVGAYFPRDALRREMMAAKYAGYRAKVYVTGIDLQRQELTAAGEWSEWEDVPPSKAMPRIAIPAPVLDDRTGDVVNQSELDQVLEVVKSAQELLMQPPHHEWQAGDEWLPPPLPGHPDLLEEEEEEEEKEEAKDEPRPREPERDRAPPPPVPPAGGAGRYPGMPGGAGRFPGMPGGAGRFPGMPGGAGRFPGGPGGVPPGSGAGAEAAAKREITENLKEARKALAKKEYDRADSLARSVESNQYASTANKRAAQRILDQVAKARSKGGTPATPPGTPTWNPYGPYVPPGLLAAGPRGMPPAGVPPAGAGAATGTLLRDPNTEEPAVWAHDDSVEPGKTYRYRMRVKTWNRYVGRMKALKDPEQAKQTVLVGEWSLPSEPVTVAPKMHFFVRGPRFGRPAASVDVFTWHNGNWLKESFDVEVGDVIGGVKETKTGELDDNGRPERKPVDFTTGAVVLDLRTDETILQRRLTGKQGDFAYSDRPSLVLVYLDPADKQVKQRIDSIDRADRLYKRLDDEYKTLILD